MTFKELERSVLVHSGLLWLAWAAPNIEAVAITELSRTEKSKVCTVTACGGKRPARWLQLLDDIENYARAEGCDCVRMFGRSGWARLLKTYTTKKIILERRL